MTDLNIHFVDVNITIKYFMTLYIDMLKCFNQIFNILLKSIKRFIARTKVLFLF